MILGATFVPGEGRRDAEGKKVVFLPSEVETRGSDEGEQSFVKATGEPVEIQWDKMSKSRGNVVNPDDVMERYGADAVRMYEMFMGPLEQSAPWQTTGLVGVHRFLQRVHRLYFGDGPASILRAFPPGEGTPRQRKLLHRTIHEVTARMDRLAFNTAIASLMVFVRDIQSGADEPLARDAAEQFCLLVAPFAPHLAEEIWAALGHTRSLAYEPWPAADEALIREDTYTLVIQIGGKRRAEIQAPKGASKDQLVALAMASEDVRRRLEGREPRRVVVVPGRLVNFVV
jgi:leucyl-tRNA synthetase